MTAEFTFFNQVIRFSIAAAIAYCIPVYFYIHRMTYEESYVLYVGNFLFAAMIGVFIAWFYKKHESSIGTIRLVVIGGKAAVAGIVAACIFITIMIFIFAPQVFKSVVPENAVLKGAPAQFNGKNFGFGQVLYLNAVLGNAGASFFISLLIPFSVMKNIYPGEKREKQTIKNENPKKNYPL